MEISIIQALLVFVVAFIMGIDQFSFLESLYQPIVTCPIIGAILGNFELGVVVGGAYQLVQIGSMPIGGAQPPNAISGGIMATVFAVSLGMEATADGVGPAYGRRRRNRSWPGCSVRCIRTVCSNPYLYDLLRYDA